MRLQSKLHSNALNVNILSVPAKPNLQQEPKCRTRMSVFITLQVSLTEYETITFIMHLEATNCHMCPLISSLSTVGVDKSIIICRKSRANYYTHICILSFCHILGSYWKIKSCCWLAYFTTHLEYIVCNQAQNEDPMDLDTFFLCPSEKNRKGIKSTFEQSYHSPDRFWSRTDHSI
jgi:hypothetical protein